MTPLGVIRGQQPSAFPDSYPLHQVGSGKERRMKMLAFGPAFVGSTPEMELN
jgi:hypothetical protein